MPQDDFYRQPPQNQPPQNEQPQYQQSYPQQPQNEQPQNQQSYPQPPQNEQPQNQQSYPQPPQNEQPQNQQSYPQQPQNEQPQYQQSYPQQPQNEQPQNQQPKIFCPKCGGTNITFQVTQVKAKSSHNGAGCLWTIGRWFLILCTCGLWLIVGKHNGKSKTKIINRTMAVCQNCGHTWKA